MSVDLNAGGFWGLFCGVAPQRREGIVILMSGRGKTNCDQMEVGELIIDRQALSLIRKRAQESNVTEGEAFQKILSEALREYQEQHTAKEWWTVK